jgi:hypothetical protein
MWHGCTNNNLSVHGATGQCLRRMRWCMISCGETIVLGMFTGDPGVMKCTVVQGIEETFRFVCSHCEQARRRIQELQGTRDVTSLAELLSSAQHQGKLANLNHCVIHAPLSSTAGSAAWRSVPFWPIRSTPVAQKEQNERPEQVVVLKQCSERELVCTMSGAGTQISHGSLMMTSETALVFDCSCSGVVVSNVEIYGVQSNII